MATEDLNKDRPGQRRGEAQQPQYGHSREPEESGDDAPKVYGVESQEEYPSEVSYGDQDTEYDDRPPGRGHGGAGYGYGSTTGPGPSGGSDVTGSPGQG